MERRLNGPIVTIELTAEQKEQIWQATGKRLTVLGLTPEALEERVAPGMNIIQNIRP